jgi:DNA-binding transcriptional LysR family regulator
LERLRRGVRPTPAGYALIHHAQIVLAQIERLRGDLREHASGGLRAHIRLTSNTSALEAHLPDILSNWPAMNPGVDIEVSERLSHEIGPAIAQSRADIGILTHLGGAEGLQTFSFRADNLVLIAPRDHRLAGQRSLAFANVLDEDFVGLQEGSALADHLAWQAAQLGQSLRLRIRMRGLDAVCQMVEAGVGISVVPEIAARRRRRSMSFSFMRLSDSWARRQLLVCTRRLDALPTHARQLVEYLVSEGKAER